MDEYFQRLAHLRERYFPFAIFFLFSLLGSVAWNQAFASTPIPAPMKAYLDQHYPGWVLANTSKQDVAKCFDKRSPFLPSLVWGDFNGDGVRDYAIQISHRRRIMQLIFLSNSSVHVLANWEADRGFPFGVVPKGTKYGDFGQQKEITFPVDVLRSITCGQGEDYYVFKGGKFKEINNRE